MRSTRRLRGLMAVTVTAVIIGSVLVVSDVARAVDVNSPPRISIGGASVVEGNMNRRFLRFSVTLSWPAPGPITVQYATGDPGDSATAPADYVAKAGTLSFTAKQRNKFVAVRTQVDTIVEGDQTFTMKLSSPSGASLGIDTATATIIDDDPPVGNRVSIGDATIVEPCAGPKVLTSVMITLAARLNTSEVVNVVTGPLSGGATAGVDYTAMNKTFTFAAGNFTKELKVPILSDLALEGAEQFQVTLTLISGAAPVGKATGTVTIIDCQPT